MRIHFLGTVMPTSVRVTLARNPYVGWKSTSGELTGMTELQITDSNVNAIMDLNKFDAQDNLREAINHAQDVADMTMNVIALQTGNAFSVRLDKIILPDGKIADTHCKELEFPKQMTALARQSDFEQVVLMAMSDHNLRLRFVISRMDYGRLAVAPSAPRGLWRVFAITLFQTVENDNMDGSQCAQLSM